MGYILKTNMRRRESGGKLQAKIVSPDKRSVIYREYPVQIKTQSLSDKECVIRDLQQMDAILTTNNDFNNIKNRIEEFTTALNSATNGSKIRLVHINPDVDGNGTQMINNEGAVLCRPKYNTVNTNSDFETELYITVSKGDVSEDYRKSIIIPAYSADEVIGQIKAKWTNSAMWEEIKGGNYSQENLHTSLVKPTNIEILEKYGLTKYYDATDPDAIPQLSFTYPDYETGLISNGTSVASLSASTVYQKKSNTALSVEEVFATDLHSTERTDMGLSTSDNITVNGEVDLYRLRSANRNENKITSKFTLSDATLTCDAEVSNVGFLSNKVTYADIQENIVNSINMNWFFNTSTLTEYGLLNSTIAGTSSTNRLEVHIPAGKNVVVKLAKAFTALIPNTAADGNDGNQINDTKNIGYYYLSTDPQPKGFANNMLYVRFGSGDTPMHMSGTMIDLNSPATFDASNDTNQIDQIANTTYMFLNSAEFTAPINVNITIGLLRTALNDAMDVTTVFLKLIPTAS